MFLSVLLNSTHILHKDAYPVCIIVTNKTLKVSTRCNIPILLDGLAGLGVGDWDPARYTSSCGTLCYGLNRECRSAADRGGSSRIMIPVVQPRHQVSATLYAIKVWAGYASS